MLLFGYNWEGDMRAWVDRRTTKQKEQGDTDPETNVAN